VFLNLAAIMNSGSRGALLGIWVGAMFYFSLRGNRRLNLLALGATYLAILVLLVGIVHLPANNPLARLLTQGQQNTSAAYSDQARSQLFQNDLARIDAHPFF